MKLTWRPAGTAHPHEELTDVMAGYWAAVSPTAEGLFSWLVVAPDGKDAASGTADDANAAKAAVSRWDAQMVDYSAGRRSTYPDGAEAGVMSTLAELHASAVATVLAQPVPPCAECGTPMAHGQGTEHGAYEPKDVFTEVAADGTAYGPAADLAHLFDPAANWLGMSSPYAYLARLGELCSEATSAKRCETTWLYERTIREYTSLKVRLDTGGYHHPHMPAREPWTYDPDRKPRGVVMPYHCGTPAHLRPSGWYCRACGDLLTDATADLRDI